ncbi:MAG: DUF1924 domain-containing protein [Burkholderiales bacterium]
MSDPLRRRLAARLARVSGASLCATLVLCTTASAALPQDLLRDYEARARAQSQAYAGVSAERGALLFRSPQGREWSCASCHGESPLTAGRHAKTGKTIAPLAPSANPQRFTDPAQVEKWFKRNCADVLGRECTPAEKGDVLAWLASLR